MSKYEEFLNKKKYIAQNWGMKCESEHLWSLVEEILEQFKLLEDNLERRKKVETQITATRLHLQSCNKQKIKEATEGRNDDLIDLTQFDNKDEEPWHPCYIK